MVEILDRRSSLYHVTQGKISIHYVFREPSNTPLLPQKAL
jgi:hypothetical protein